jgi:lipoprotein-anchoring transpeptidase ErfK/SrfK
MIYIHGTNQSGRLGQPNSHGCVLLSDTGITELFEAVGPGALVMIG